MPYIIPYYKSIDKLNLDLFQHPSTYSKPISTLEVFALEALLSGLDRKRRYINLQIRYELIDHY